MKHTGKWFLLVVLLLLMLGSQAQTGPGIKIKRVLNGANGQLAKDSAITVQDSIYFSGALAGKLDTPYQVRNIITLSINEYSNVYITAAFSATANVRIYYTKPDFSIDSTDQLLTINYDTANTYTMRNSFVFNNAHQVKVKVLSVTAPANRLAVLLLENEMEVHPVYKLACVDNAVKSVASNNPPNTDSTDEIVVSWPVTTGADEYDLEWAYIDSAALQNYNTAALIFANNTTRVTISNNSYAIPLLYDDNGTLYYRVRAVQKRNNVNRIETSWSSDFSGGLGAYNFRGHQRNLNWQSSVSYAEEGKRKVVVQYFDGSLRSRQTVTKDNTTNTTTIAETFYDYQGRPAVNVLPAPTLNNVIKYTRNVNAAMNGAEYDKDNYDYIASPAEYLSASAKPMSNTSGANQYYSANNPEKNVGVNKYIPDAGGYAFSETEYTQDNTGRIRRQGGVGETFKLGSNHEARYYYGTAMQEDLYALFGTEVGDNSHYFKNMMSDANGQYAVTYLDMHGRTIATALAGSPESGNLDDLPSKEVVTVTDSLSGPGTNVVSDLSMSNRHSQLVTQDGNVSFKYMLTPPVLQKKDCDNNTICYTGLYDLQITITDDCYNQHLGGKPFDTILHNYNAGAIIPNCNTPVPIELGFSLYLLKGSYEVTKTLTISKVGIDYFRDSIFLKNNVCTTFEQFNEEQKVLQRNKQCIPDCKSCLDSIGSWDVFRVRYVTGAGNNIADTAIYRGEAWTAYQSALVACNDLCGTTSEGDDIRVAMLLDVSGPSGQYAIEADSSSIYSIYYQRDENTLPPYQRDSVTYLDEEGHPDLVYNENTNTYVKPQDLEPGQFANKFKSSWAEALLKFHPEYCKLIESERHAASYKWDLVFGSVDTYAEAKQLGYLNPTANSTLLPIFPISNTDPLSQESNDLKNKLNAKLNNYNNNYSMWSIAASSVRCPAGDNSCPANYNTPALAFSEGNICSNDLDMAWRTFRQLYLNAKKDVINELLTNASCAGITRVPADALLAAGKQPRFTNASAALNQSNLGYLSNGNLNQNTVQDSADLIQSRLYDQNCRAYVQTWMQQLSACTYYSPAAREWMTSRMVEVCKAGSDVDHSKGSSTVKPGSTYQYKSFEEVINAYNAANNITDVLNCNAQLITFPQPYDKQTAYSDISSYARPDDCQCEKLHDLQAEYNAVKKITDFNLSVYLQRTRGVHISQSDLNVLIDACGIPAGSGCNWLPKPISIPVVMQCTVAPACVNCTEVNNWYNTFKSIYPGIIPVLSVNDSLQLKKNTLFAAYMNNHLGFSKDAWEYIAFMDSCKLPADDGTQICKPGAPNSNKMVSSYSNGGTDNISDILRTKENGYLMAGATTGSGAGGKDGYIIKTDNNGNLLWSKTYGGEQSDEFIRCKPTADNGYIAIGNTYSWCYDKGAILIVKLDKDGNVLWNKAIDFGFDYGGRGTDIVETREGNYAFAGLRTTSGTATDWVTGVVSDSGELSWMKQRGSAVARDKISLLENNDTLIAATSIGAAASADAVVMKVNKLTGALINLSQYDLESKGNITTNILQTSNGYKLSVVSGNGALLDLNAAGNIISAKKIGSPGTLSEFTTYATTDGGLIASQSIAQDVYWQKLGADNSVQWSSHVKIDGNDRLYRIIHNVDGTMAGAGIFNNTSMLMRANTVGKTGCRDSVETISATDITSLCTRKTVATQTEVTLGDLNLSTIPLLELLTTPAMAVISCPGMDSCYYVGNGPILCGNATPVFAGVDINEISNCSDSTVFAVSAGTVLYNAYLDSIRNSFNEDYIRMALQAGSLERYAVTYSTSEYHYTLFYYDQAGNLVKTVPPAGVIKNRSAAWISSVKAAKATGTKLVPAHKMATEYRYNTVNEVVAQKGPDAGKSKYWYDRVGRKVISQNAKQAGVNGYTYMTYDDIGRMTEVGELTSSSVMTDSISRKASALTVWMNVAKNSRRNINNTVYDLPNTPFEGDLWNATNLRNRVSWSAIFNSAAEQTSGNYATATFYNYDIHGNVKTLLQDYKQGGMADAGNSNRWKKIAYSYDLISGKVNTISYQPGQADAFYHRYRYDAENRITNVETSRDSVYWENDAYYQYYKHGPLARTVIGQQQVQGIDYGYTLWGWSKGTNSTSLTPANDMGNDGSSGSIVAKDAFGYALHYYGTEDYVPINSTVNPFSQAAGFKPLFNGNITAISQNISSLGEPFQYIYRYDVLNRLSAMQAQKGLNAATNTWTPVALPDFQEKISYDENGNILSYKRNGNNTFAGKPLAMDSLTYGYQSGTNKLDFIADGIAAANYDNDIDNQSAGNYTYDAVGNIIKDNASGISNISWNIYGKIVTITKADGTIINYSYDVAGNRISKKINGVETWYVRDAGGNVISVYTKGKSSINNGALTQTETDLYGSSRLGIHKMSTNVQSGIIPTPVSLTGLGSGISTSFVRGRKFFELSNHLNNVLATVSDKKDMVSVNGNTVDHYEADLVSAQEYYPFGMQMPGRAYSDSNYRYGFNGKEKDDEVKGSGNQYDYGFRIYDARIGKFLSTDPLYKSYPELTPYQFASNTPIQAEDMDGLEVKVSNVKVFADQSRSVVTVQASVNINIQIVNLSSTASSSLSLDLIKQNIAADFNNKLKGVNSYKVESPYKLIQTTDGSIKIDNKNPGKYNYTVKYDVVVNTNVSVVTDKSKISPNNNLVFGFVDKIKKLDAHDDVAGLARSTGKVAIGEARYFDFASAPVDGKNLIFHELLHLLGVDDYHDKDNKKNIVNVMNSLGSMNNGKLTEDQIASEAWATTIGAFYKILLDQQAGKGYQQPSSPAHKEDSKTQMEDFVSERATTGP